MAGEQEQYGQDQEQTQDRQGRVSAAADKVRQSAADAYGAARERTGALYGSARDRAASAYESTRETASRAGRRAADGLDANPMAAVVGGLAVGALVAALLPRTRGENQALGAFSGRLHEGARNAARAAQDAGRDKLDELGFTREAARDKLSELASGAGEAFRSSAAAAAKAVAGGDQP